MLTRLVLILALLGAPGAASGMECSSWQRLAPDQKPAAVNAMIEEKLNSPRSQDFTSANHPAIRRCLQPLIPTMIEDFDGICSEGISAPMDALDERFRRYFVSCV